MYIIIIQASSGGFKSLLVKVRPTFDSLVPSSGIFQYISC